MIQIKAFKFDVRFGPKADIRLFNHLVGDSKDAWWNGEAENLRGLEINNRIEFGRLQRPVFLCAKPARDPDGECGLLAATTKLEPDGIEQGTFGNPYFHVRLADGRTGYIQVTNFIALTTDVDLEKAAAECERRGEP